MISTPPAREATPPGGERRWYQRVFDGNGLLWVLYFTFIILSIFTVSSAISSDFYKSLSSGGFNPIAKHWVMLFMGGLYGYRHELTTSEVLSGACADIPTVDSPSSDGLSTILWEVHQWG